MYVTIPKDQRMLIKGVHFHPYLALYDHLYVMNDKSKTTLMAGTAMRSHCLWGLVSHLSCILV